YRIQDSGPGIQKEDIEKIFDEFEQSTHTDSGSNFGNGLGLTIVKTLVEAMNGNIKVKSVQGKGSVFTIDFSLPPSTDVQTNQITDSLLKPISTFRNTVWIIDDDSFILDLCQNILSKYNIDHQSFHSPIDCLNQPFNPELSHILTD